jgi:hypothetical protein
MQRQKDEIKAKGKRQKAKKCKKDGMKERKNKIEDEVKSEA